MKDQAAPSRRQFALFSMLALAPSLGGRWLRTTKFSASHPMATLLPAREQLSPPTLKAGEVVERIKQNLGVPWRDGPTDTFKTGGPDTMVTGIATTVMSTFDVLQRAAAAGLNMIITHEPTFWTATDDTRNFQNDAVYKKKLQFAEQHNLAIWRFHDHLHARRPDMTSLGLAHALGWDKYASKEEERVFLLPPVTLRDLAKNVEKRLKVKALRVIGNPAAKVSRAALLQGTPPFHAASVVSNVDVVVAGEQREWEGVEYLYDANFAGMSKGMILVGHWVSEDPGMQLCAEWLKSFVSEIPVSWLPAGEPFWRP
jgi:putative NIF3 family GTP cyclohydrolase 1 type 2